MGTDVAKRLAQASKAPSEKGAFDVWLTLQDAIELLRSNAKENEFVLYAGMGHTFIHALAVPARLLNPPDIEDLMAWNCNAGSSWGISITFSDPPAVSISSPLESTGSKTLSAGEQLLFARHFEGRPGERKGYFEVLQKLVHTFDLHFIESRNAYCRLDKLGDIEEVIRIVEFAAKGGGFGGTVITIDRGVLDEYLLLTDSVAVRTFDFTRFRSGGFGGWSDHRDIQYTKNAELSYRSHVEPGHASYARGYQIVRPAITKESIIKRLDFSSVEKEQQYASFIAHDWKNKVVKEISCAPGATANYFTKSDLPFELSPAFFRPEVLSKYKADTEKYSLQDRSISCRGAWHLQTYDINEAGQVHTYLVYLRNLPYEEQLYWKAYNEKPKGSLSKRAIKTDFAGTWDLDYDPLPQLKNALRNLDHRETPWWTLRSEKLLETVHYPVTSSADEWSNEILQLDQLVVEGFETKWLRAKAKALGRNDDAQFASLKLVEECLIGAGFVEVDARNTVAPLREIHDLRSKLKGHASGQEAATIRKRVLAEHGSYKGHFRKLCERCDSSIRAIIETMKKLP